MNTTIASFILFGGLSGFGLKSCSGDVTPKFKVGDCIVLDEEFEEERLYPYKRIVKVGENGYLYLMMDGIKGSYEIEYHDKNYRKVESNKCTKQGI